MLRSSLVARPCAARVFAPALAPAAPKRGALLVSAAQAGKPGAAKGPKKMDSAVKRAMIAEERRMYNKARKSACATRIKKVLVAAEQMVAAAPKDESEVKPLEALIAEAYSEIDKAVSKGILHKNNAARKKARCARHKKRVLISANLYKPKADSPDHAKWAKLHAKAA